MMNKMSINVEVSTLSVEIIFRGKDFLEDANLSINIIDSNNHYSSVNTKLTMTEFEDLVLNLKHALNSINRFESINSSNTEDE